MTEHELKEDLLKHKKTINDFLGVTGWNPLECAENKSKFVVDLNESMSGTIITGDQLTKINQRGCGREFILIDKSKEYHLIPEYDSKKHREACYDSKRNLRFYTEGGEGDSANIWQAWQYFQKDVDGKWELMEVVPFRRDNIPQSAIPILDAILRISEIRKELQRMKRQTDGGEAEEKPKNETGIIAPGISIPPQRGCPPNEKIKERRKIIYAELKKIPQGEKLTDTRMVEILTALDNTKLLDDPLLCRLCPKTVIPKAGWIAAWIFSRSKKTSLRKMVERVRYQKYSNLTNG